MWIATTDPAPKVAAWFNNVPPQGAFPDRASLTALTRLLPMQDPQYSWMWAESCELVEPRDGVTLVIR